MSRSVLPRRGLLARGRRTAGRLLPLLLTILAFAASAPAQTPSFRSAWSDEPDRPWVGGNFWANRLQDWRVRRGRLECIETRHLPMRTVHLLTRRLASGSTPFTMTVRTGLANPDDVAVSRDGMSGFLVGVGGELLDYRAAAIVHGLSGRGAGYFAGVDALGRLVLHDNERPLPARTAPLPGEVTLPRDVELRFEARPVDGETAAITLEARDPETGREISRVSARIALARLVGNVALVSHPGRKEGAETAARFWFDDWTLQGKGVARDDRRSFGPIVSSQYTVSRNVLKLTAQFVPLGEADSTIALLQVGDDGDWKTLAESAIIRPGFTATFRVPDWDDTRDAAYRVHYMLRGADGRARPVDWSGTIRRNPEDKETIVLAAFTGNHNNAHDLAGGWGATDPSRRGDWVSGMWFPHEDVVDAVRTHDPDLLFFSGDQVYEGASPTFADRRHLMLDYLYKWYLWCWAYRDLTRSMPAVVIPDDHDVYQGNVWGHGGRPARNQNDGGYVHPAAFVKMVERTQTSHLPDPYDPAPVEQGIGVYFTDLKWGRISLAILEDRKFKSGCSDERMPPSGTGRTDHFNDPDFDTKRLDLPGLTLLGPRQLAFLDSWADDWRRTDMKIALSQTIFAGMATHHGKGLSFLIADLDSNGWPQSGRNRALRRLRRAFAPHVGGDQHLATMVQHGVDAHRDAIWSFCVPSVANFYPRQWLPPRDGGNRAMGALGWTGDHVDGFGNRVTVHAATNPGPSGREPANLHDGMPGYGIVRFRKIAGTYTFECWPRSVDPGDPSTGRQYAGWPVTIQQLQNDGRSGTGVLPEIFVRGLDRAVVRITDETTGVVVRTLRIKKGHWQPRVFSDGPFSLDVGCPDRFVWRHVSGVRPVDAARGAEPIVVDFGS